MKSVINLLIGCFILFSPMAFAHGGEDHGEEQKKSMVTATYFASVANSDLYELLLKYEPLKKGEAARLKLYVSDYTTNKPVDKAQLKISSNDDKSLQFSIKQTDVGIYEITTRFPENKSYNLNISINSALGPDLMVVEHIEVGKLLPQAEDTKPNDTSIVENKYVMFAGGFALALLLMLVFSKLKNKKVNATFLITLLLFGTTPLPTKLQAHGGEDHGDENSRSGGNLSDDFLIPKETQFLFGVYTKKIEVGDFTEGTKLFGTIIPSSNGQAIVTTPQNGRIIALDVNVGQQVKKGQQLAVIEQNIDAASQVTLLAEKNNIDAEYEAAKKEYERLKVIQDIASKKEFSEAEARYQKASENKKLYNSGGGKTIILKSPIDGLVGNFMFTIGSTINTGETVFTITNLSKVYVEAQVFDKDAEKIKEGIRYNVECTNDNHKTAEVKLLALAQNINPTNQSQRVLFEMENAGGEFKIGEFVNIYAFAQKSDRKIAVPNTAISELNGKPIVFIKDNAERYSLSYVALGENNGSFTVINKGLEEGERLVVNGTYQLKMIYLNQ